MKRIALMASLAFSSIAAADPSAGKLQTGDFNYAEVLQKSLFFYDAQRSGDLPADFRVNWRGDSALTDGSDVGRDLTGGFYDAGDHVKFGLPLAYTLTTLAWGGIEYPAAYTDTNQMGHLKSVLKWGCDYLMKCHVRNADGSTNTFYAQVGNGDIDHAFWGSAEILKMARPSYKVDAANPGTDVAAETAAALAATAILFQTSDPTYATQLLSHAQSLYAFADAYRGKYSDAIPDAAKFYNSWSGFNDELVWGALWLYRATGSATYLQKATATYPSIGGRTTWAPSWDDKSYCSYVLFSTLSTAPLYRTDAQRWLNYWSTGTGIPRTPGGLATISDWGSLRYAANVSFCALLYADRIGDPTGNYTTFAKRQIHYALGQNPANRSYVCGFGVNPPVNPHHRTAHGTWLNNGGAAYPPSRHVLYGALVGGPGRQDNYSDIRSSYELNEVALDYNASFTGAIAALYQKYGGFTLADFPQPEISTIPEFSVDCQINAQAANFTEFNGTLLNRSAFPARDTANLKFRYFIDITEGKTAGYTPASYTTSASPAPMTATGLLPWDAAKNIYYIEVSFPGISHYPGGGTTFQRTARFRISLPSTAPAAAWNPANDFSFQGVTATVAANPRLAVYENGTRIGGTEPPAAIAPVTLATWKNSYFQNPALPTAPTYGGDLADPDADGVPNLLEYAMGTHPLQGKPSDKPAVSQDAAGVYLTYSENTAISGYTLSFEQSLDLVTWQPIVPNVITRTATAIPGVDQLKSSFPRPTPMPTKFFLRAIAKP